MVHHDVFGKTADAITVDQEPIKRNQAAATKDVGTHQNKLLDVLGAAAVDVLRVNARHTHIPRPRTVAHGRSARRILGKIMLLVTVQLIATAASVDLTTILQLYGLLAAMGLAPGWREPYFLIQRPAPHSDPDDLR
jgi:hypothetical protein